MAQEKNFENQIKRYLEDTGGWFLKYWAGAKYTKEGIPDILACIHGKFYGIEVKAPNGRPSVIQLVTLRKIREAGGVGVLLYPKDLEAFKWFILSGDPLWYLDNIARQEDWLKKLNK